MDEIEQRLNQLEKDFYTHEHKGYDKSTLINSIDLVPYTKGDLIVGLSSNQVDNLAVGSDYQHLISLSSETLGLKWEAARGVSQFTAYENISANDPVRVTLGTVTYMNETSTAFVDAEIYGSGGLQEEQASNFIIPAGGGIVTSVIMYLKKNNSPADNVVCEILADSGGNPTGASQGTVSVAASTVPTSVGAVTFTFASPLTLTAGTYWVKASRSGSRDTTNRVTLANDGASATANDKVNNSGVWGNQANLSFVVQNADGTAGQLKKAKADFLPNCAVFGFAIAAITASQTGYVQHFGIMSGFSSLSTGYRYYLSDTGTVSTTAGTLSRVVGTAVSTTQISLAFS